MAVTAQTARFNVPFEFDNQIFTGVPLSGANINVGDWLAWSGTSLFPTYAGHTNTAYWKASGAGVAMEANPVYDPAGRVVQNTALRFATNVRLRGSAAFSGIPANGVGAYPVSTGSAAFAPTGATGLGATWQTSIKLSVSGGTGAGGSGVAHVIGWYPNANAGTGQLDLFIPAPRPDYY